jgi:hypothetical protein
LGALERIASGELLAAFPVVAIRLRDGREHSQQFSAAGQVLRAVPIAEKAVVADALKRIRKNMQQKDYRRTHGRQDHNTLPACVYLSNERRVF